MAGRVAGEVALVTGAGQGIGEAIARTLAAEGASVALVDLAAENAERVAAAIREAGGRAIALGCDVADSAQVNQIVRAAAEALGPIQILVSAAGGMLGSVRKPVEEVTDAEWQRVLDVNLSGCFYMARAVVPYMKAQRYGRIVQISSGAGRSHSRTGVYAYTSAKAGVLGLTRQLAVELGAYNVTVNAVAPGLITSPLGVAAWAERTEEQRQKVLDSIALGRLGEPAEIAEAVLFLASRSGGYITGQTIGVDGGHWMF